MERGRHHLLNDTGVGGGAEERHIVAAAIILPLVWVLSRLQPPPLTQGDDLLLGPRITSLAQEPLPPFFRLALAYYLSFYPGLN